MDISAGGNANTRAPKTPGLRANTYMAKGQYEVCIGGKTIARIYVRPDGTSELRILQGMPRDATVEKLLTDCPEFCEQNSITADTYPLLFSA